MISLDDIGGTEQVLVYEQLCRQSSAVQKKLKSAEVKNDVDGKKKWKYHLASTQRGMLRVLSSMPL
ncbi:MAG: hypothetical protein PHE77_00045 [Candidatus Pacebacteria bacterium]|nr:hypothetical protein [Candidatus Paceibacterota bacterium]